MNTIKQVADSIAILEAQIAVLAAERSALEKDLAALVWPTMEKKLSEKGSEHGDHVFDIDGVKVKGTIRRTVKWDSERLQAVAATLPADQRGIFKVDVAVPEKIWDTLSISNPSLAEQLAPAREVKYSSFTTKLVAGE